MALNRFNLKCFSFKNFLLIALLFSGLKVFAQSWPAGVHDPSRIIKEGDKYWIFSTGQGIWAIYSADMVTWTAGEVPFPNGEFPEWVKNYAKTETDTFSGLFWAPDIIYMNNQYYLYYTCSIWATMSSCIGVVVNKTLDPESPDYEWIDQGDIGIYSPDFSVGGMGWDVNALDPAPMRAPDGKVWLVYGSFNKGGILVTEVDTVTGKPIGDRISIANSWTGTYSGYFEGEGGSMFYRDGYYYLVYNKGICCNGIESSYYMVIGRSENPTGPFIDKDGNAMKVIGSASGGTVLFKHDDTRGEEDRYFGHGHFGLYSENGIDYVTFHYYSPTGDFSEGLKGWPALGFAMLKWGEDGWPMISFDFIEDGTYSLINANSKKAMDVQNHTSGEGALLWQYSFDNSLNTQKWIFKSLGTGEYTIQNYDDLNYLSTSDQLLSLASTAETINQKYRAVKGIDNKLIIYPTTRDEMIEIPYAYTADYQIKLWWNTNHACQRWSLIPFNGEANFLSTCENEDSVKLYPNPANDKIYIEVVKNATLEVYNSAGQKVLAEEMIESVNTIDISHLEPGLYIFDVLINKSSVRQLIIKK
ncbi:family 43 glycosylhydrolase [Candidatus Peregrinibacteria bacterium]|nr:family 43 glycosylhydrolase [Candidatus Peregrinibacteria bacterium]